DVEFVKRFTDLPLLVRTDTLERLRPQDVIEGYRPKDLSGGPSVRIQGLTGEQRERIGDFCVWDAAGGEVKPISRDEVGELLEVDPALSGEFEVTTVDGSKVKVLPVLEMYRRHLADYDVATAAEISGAAPEMIERLADDLATVRPA